MWGDIQDIFLFGCPKTIDITGFFKKFCIATRTNKKGRQKGVLFCWSAGERILFCRLNTPCPDQTRKTTLTVFFHTIFPSVGDKPAQKSLGVFFIWCQGEQKACAKGWSVP